MVSFCIFAETKKQNKDMKTDLLSIKKYFIVLISVIGLTACGGNGGKALDINNEAEIINFMKADGLLTIQPKLFNIGLK